ncbi:alanine--glyoxylate aminotransferase [candidate division KSB1 bacterium]|nr:MAG: alanine--glyoxylate aminotransferase [candidate division KSB1 bacterium]
MKEYSDLKFKERILMGPGPSNVNPRVLLSMSYPMIGHLDPDFLKITIEVQELLRWLFQTKNMFTIPISGTGSSGMETVFANCFERGEKVIIGVNGVFGKRMCEVCEKYGIIPVKIEEEWGKPIKTEDILNTFKKNRDSSGIALVHGETSTGVLQPLEDTGKICKENNLIFVVDTVTSLGGVPVKVDEWNIDACYSGTQKCISCPPGLSPVTFSEKAVKKIKNRKSPIESWYLDMTMVEKYWSSERIYHHTAPISMIFALREALRIIFEEGLERRFARHKKNSNALIEGLKKMKIEPFVDEDFRLASLNSVKIPDGIDDVKVRKELLNTYNIEIGSGLGDLKGKIWRIGLMGESSSEKNVVYFLGALEEILLKEGFLNSAGQGTAKALQFYSSFS